MEFKFITAESTFSLTVSDEISVQDVFSLVEAEVGYRVSLFLDGSTPVEPSDVVLSAFLCPLYNNCSITVKKYNAIEENLLKALESNPEAFGEVEMLYIPIKINNIEIPAFVDTGAQRTIFPVQLIEKCHLTNLVDDRFKGVAQGVGTQEIKGRIHSLSITFNDGFVADGSVTVLDTKDVGMLIGLDWLKKHRAFIDLTNNSMVIPHGSGLGENDAKSVIHFLPHWKVKELKLELGLIELSPEDIKINQLVEMGFEKEMCRRALEMTNWNVELAAGVLFQ
ncbi:Ddi1 protein [Martiniozyma asiatica (nom. inval.)]|nr:Ddi1 protein [Martiniozyma asiatica]